MKFNSVILIAVLSISTLGILFLGNYLNKPSANDVLFDDQTFAAISKIQPTRIYANMPLKLFWRDAGAKNYYIYIGPKRGGITYFKKIYEGDVLSATITPDDILKDIPAKSDVYVRLGTNKSKTDRPNWIYTDYLYNFENDIKSGFVPPPPITPTPKSTPTPKGTPTPSIPTTPGIPGSAQITSPTPGSSISFPVTFKWNPATTSSEYNLAISNTKDKADNYFYIFESGETSKTVTKTEVDRLKKLNSHFYVMLYTVDPEGNSVHNTYEYNLK